MGEIQIDNAAMENVLVQARRDCLEGAQDDLVEAAKETVHVITEHLKDSIHAGDINEDATKAEVVADAEYAIYEHEGTRYRPPHPFFSEAIDLVAARRGR